MSKLAITMLVAVVVAAPSSAQQKKAGNTITYDITVTAENTPYTGTIALAVAGGKVSGDMHITKPTEINGKPAGTAKAGEMKLDFPYRMVERGCDGRIVMAITLPAKKDAGPATGTAEISGCGRPEGNILPATIEMTPQPATKKAP